MSGGPRWRSGANAGERSGIAAAVVVGEAVYLVDAGRGVGNQLTKAGFSVADLRGIFLTHLHSDHCIELASLAIFGLFTLWPSPLDHFTASDIQLPAGLEYDPNANPTRREWRPSRSAGMSW